jgi:molybdopterin-guanine dinucleotide biosynthesis protein A
MNTNSINIAIIAGGKSTRMGVDKSFLELNRKPILGHVIERVSTLNLPIIIITNLPEKYERFGLPIFTDLIADQGALGGLYTALSNSSAIYSYTLCVACDMPFLNASLLAHLLTLCEGSDAVVPVIDNRPEPLHAIYSTSCLPAIRASIEAGQRKMAKFYEGLQVRFVEDAECRTFDPDLRSFINVNTPEEWQSAKQLGDS